MSIHHIDTPFDLVGLRRCLGSEACRFDVVALAECASTNAQLLEMAEAGAPSGTVLIADRQTAGRGRRGRIWHSSPGDSLTFSLFWRFPADSRAPNALSLVVGLAIAQALEGLGAVGITLKWPNDLLHENRKLAGILIELVPGAPRAAVIGIGINLRMPAALPQELSERVIGLDSVLGVMPAREAVLGAFLAELASTFDIYADQGFTALRGAWQRRHYFAGRAVRLLVDHAPDAYGVCAGVDDDGALLLDIEGVCQRFIGGEISLRPA